MLAINFKYLDCEKKNSILFHIFLCNSQYYHHRGPVTAVDDPMNCCPRPKAEANSSSGHPQHRGGDNLTVTQKDLKHSIVNDKCKMLQICREA